VHEVVADVLFDAELPEKDFLALPAKLESEFGKAAPMEFQGLGLISAPGFPAQVQITKSLGGWQFAEGATPKWFIRLQKNRFTLNMARSEAWPRGDYVGWDAIFRRLTSVANLLAPVYSALTARRLGLRYINRFSVPIASDLSDWCTLRLQTPNGLAGQLGTFVRTTFTVIAEHPRFSATVSLAQEEVQPPPLRDGEVPFLLDIDVFNLRPTDAPPFKGLLEWFKAAHLAENAVFERCITDKLRERFDGG
jgi:uncharacterized protein (TIGR04255 family)